MSSSMDTIGAIYKPASVLREIQDTLPVYREMNTIHATGSVNTPMKRMCSQNNLAEKAGLADFIESANNQIAQEAHRKTTARRAFGTERL